MPQIIQSTNAASNLPNYDETFDMESECSSDGFYSSSVYMTSSSSRAQSSDEYESDDSFQQVDDIYGQFTKAIMNGNLDKVQSMLLSGLCDVNHIYDREQNYSFLHLACLMGHPDIIKVLLDHGANTNLVTIDGQQPIDFIEPDDLNTLSYMLKKMSTNCTSASIANVNDRQ
jgi:ankyrin repeat protein